MIKDQLEINSMAVNACVRGRGRGGLEGGVWDCGVWEVWLEVKNSSLKMNASTKSHAS